MTRGLRIVVGGYLIRKPLGGLAWHYIQYLVGLANMGHDVYYLEDSEDQSSGNDSSFGLRFAATVLDSVGMGDRWAYYEAIGKTWLGPAGDRILNVCSHADLFLNVSHSIPVRPWLTEVPRRVLIDTDPAFGQVRHLTLPLWLERSLSHNVFLTYGENFGKPGCKIPDDGLPWKPTRQPIVIDLWPYQTDIPKPRFTTVMSWKSYPATRNEHVYYGLKSDSFGEYIDLPKRTAAILELALDAEDDVRNDLAVRGWRITDAMSETSDPWKYRSYIQNSMAEFSIAKHGYAATRSGWFSERSAAYMASGRPVIVQDTGFTDWMRSSEGVIPFSNLDEAVSAIERVGADYMRQSRLAREVACEYFDHRRVLTQLLGDTLNTSRGSEIESSVVAKDMLREHRRFTTILRATVPEGSRFILVDDLSLGISGSFENRVCDHFLERNGVPWGRPADDAQAILELERMRSRGSEFVVFARTTRWWFDHYRVFHHHLLTHYAELVSEPELTVFDLRSISVSSTG